MDAQHSQPRTDDQPQPPRRTRADLRYLITGERDDGTRNSRLIEHGWLSTQGMLTALGIDIASATSHLERRGLLDQTVDIMGLPAYLGAIERVPHVHILAYLAGVRTMHARVDSLDADARLDYSRAARGLVTVVFAPGETAVARRFEASLASNGWAVERARDARFTDGRNPRRLHVDVCH